MKKVIIITGASGFLGNNIVRQLQNTDVEIRALVNDKSRVESLNGLQCTIYEGDVTKPETLTSIFSNLENTDNYVIHCAAIVSIASKYDPMVYQVNVDGAKNIIEKCLETHSKLVYVSSVHSIPPLPNNEPMTELSYYNPDQVVGDYAKTKAINNNYIIDCVKTRRLQACIVMPSGIIGPNDYGNTHLTALITDFANHKLPACVKGGYNFVDVRDVASGAISACQNGRNGECYLLTNEYHSIKDILDIESDLLQIPKMKKMIPLGLAKFVAPFMERKYICAHRPPLFTKTSLYTIETNSKFDHHKALSELNYQPRPINETIEDTISFLKQQNRI